MKLQLLYIELSNSLEDISAQSFISVPKSIREIEKIRKDAAELKKKIDWFNEHLSKVENSSSDSLKLLSELDRVKIRMETVSNALKESSRLLKMTDNIEAVFASGDSQQIAERLNEMNHSLQILKDVDVKEFKSEMARLEQLQDRLEGLVRPQLLQAFTQQETDAALQFVNIFEKINRSAQLLDYYYRCRQLPLDQYWNSLEKNIQNFDQESQGENPFVKWLPSFYDEVLLLVNNEVSWTSKVFPKDSSVVPTLVAKVLSHFTASFQKRIDTVVLGEQNKSGHLLEDLISLFGQTVDFSRSVLAVITSGVSDLSAVEAAKIAIFEPYFTYQLDYPNLEKKQLSKDLEKLKPSRAVFAKTINNIDHSVSKLFLAVESSVDRCVQFTSGSEGEGLVRTLNEILGDYIQHLFALLQHLREQAHLDTPTAGSDTKPSGYSTANWSYFQGALQLLQIVNKIAGRLGTFEHTLRTNLIQQRSSLFVRGGTNNETQISNGALHLKSHPDRIRKLTHFTSNLDDGAFKLLPTPTQLMSSFAASVHNFVFDTIFSFIRDTMAGIPSLEVWSSQPQISPLNLPTFSLAPLDYITQIGQHLLTLPHQLEPFSAADSSLSFDPKGIENLNNILDNDKQVPRNISFDVGESADKLDESFADGTKPVELSNSMNQDDDDNTFAFQWISAVGRGAMSLYVQKIAEIPTLSDLGSKQLITDIGYLITVLSALGVPTENSLELTLKSLKSRQFTSSSDQ
eukprot:TRINITY_DN455_c0_g1_i1.p1 TRINITY_DN455_c0_g1~~TRINITY_DN455_c0_g1_i1.p1  ORF type:complete len:742 (+),score=173.09 TRINITY_DN455_c0_g1_i1:323-2548(+)